MDRAFSHWNMERDKKREHRSFWKAIKDEESSLLDTEHIQDRTFSYLKSELVPVCASVNHCNLECVRASLLFS